MRDFKVAGDQTSPVTRLWALKSNDISGKPAHVAKFAAIDGMPASTRCLRRIGRSEWAGSAVLYETKLSLRATTNFPNDALDEG